MIFGFVSVKVLAAENGEATVLAGDSGIGFQVVLAGPAATKALPGRPVELWLHHHITDAGQRLFGFATTQDRDLFLNLMKVDGVGPKAATALMGLGKDALLKAIATADEAAVRAAPGVGPKLAKKVILELSGVLLKEESAPKGKKASAPKTPDDDLVAALVGMGYDREQSRDVVAGLPPDVDGVGERTRLALRALARR